MDWLFVLSLGFILYTYLIYPGLIVLIGYCVGRRGASDSIAPQPAVAMIIPAYNEAACIAEKIRNVLNSSYPRHLLRVVVVSDGSTDGTALQAKLIADARVQVVEIAQRQGKVKAINTVISMVNEPVLILTDAAEMFDPHAISYLVGNFADPGVGAVSGELEFIDAHTGFSRNIGLYWRYERKIRIAESRVGSIVGVTGAIYAIRRECFRTLPADTILDDVAIPFEAIRQGYRVHYEPRARAYAQATPDITQEFLRKRRTLAGNYQLISRYFDLLIPFNGPIALQFLSHKVFRLLVPYALLGMFISSWFLAEPFKSVLLASQFVFYSSAIVAFRFGKRVRLSIFTLPYTFCALNWAAVAGCYYYFSGIQTAKWEKVK
ncbi:MAG TPA: glycosyltransferase family 2 protein [Acidiferrobacterales bacterium]|nr:glycosyltransferase family 2 protein [Acidiferrobacterales bacterium]